MGFSARSRASQRWGGEVGCGTSGPWFADACEFFDLVVNDRGISEREVKVFWFDGMSA
jgi:hypothetical protein